MSDSKVKNNRAHRRLDLRLPLSFRRLDSPRSAALSTTTLNVSTGGIYFETTVDDIQPGDQLHIDLGVPDSDSRFPQHSRISTTAQVVRKVLIELKHNEDGPTFTRYGLGAAFRQDLKLVF